MTALEAFQLWQNRHDNPLCKGRLLRRQRIGLIAVFITSIGLALVLSILVSKMDYGNSTVYALLSCAAVGVLPFFVGLFHWPTNRSVTDLEEIRLTGLTDSEAAFGYCWHVTYSYFICLIPILAGHVYQFSRDGMFKTDTGAPWVVLISIQISLYGAGIVALAISLRHWQMDPTRYYRGLIFTMIQLTGFSFLILLMNALIAALVGSIDNFALAQDIAVLGLIKQTIIALSLATFLCMLYRIFLLKENRLCWFLVAISSILLGTYTINVYRDSSFNIQPEMLVIAVAMTPAYFGVREALRTLRFSGERLFYRLDPEELLKKDIVFRELRTFLPGNSRQPDAVDMRTLLKEGFVLILIVMATVLLLSLVGQWIYAAGSAYFAEYYYYRGVYSMESVPYHGAVRGVLGFHVTIFFMFLLPAIYMLLLRKIIHVSDIPSGRVLLNACWIAALPSLIVLTHSVYGVIFHSNPGYSPLEVIEMILYFLLGPLFCIATTLRILNHGLSLKSIVKEMLIGIAIYLFFFANMHFHPYSEVYFFRISYLAKGGMLLFLIYSAHIAPYGIPRLLERIDQSMAGKGD